MRRCKKNREPTKNVDCPQKKSLHWNLPFCFVSWLARRWKIISKGIGIDYCVMIHWMKGWWFTCIICFSLLLKMIERKDEFTFLSKHKFVNLLTCEINTCCIIIKDENMIDGKIDGKYKCHWWKEIQTKNYYWWKTFEKKDQLKQSLMKEEK